VQPPAQLVYEAGSLAIDAGRRELRARGVLIPIGGRAFEIIETLVRSAGELVTKDELMGRVWPGAIVGEATIQVHISAIRKALGPDRAILKTTSGRGYRLLGRWTARPRDAREAPVDPAPGRVPAAPVQGNLPIAASELIGRDAALRHVRDLISAYRAVTLTGPGGIGKTKLALAVAHALSAGFDGGAWLVDLASLSDASLVAAAVASVLGLYLGQTDISPEALARAIGRRKLLLVIDNCEHVINVVATVVEAVVRLCPMVSVLATSRELLRIDGECAFRLQPLDFPAQDAAEGHDRILEMSAVRLFIARVATARSGGQPRDEIAAIAAICQRLDGIPLAIEFAAARAATLGVAEVLSRLDDRFTLLTSGRRTALPKHRTLRATLDWSHELLSGPERVLLRRLAIFTAAFSLEAANVVVPGSGDTPPDIADGIASLVLKSLVAADASGRVMQFRLLDTTRVYAFEKLKEAGELPQLARKHAEYYRRLLETADGDRETRPARLDDLGNVRAALEWCFGADGDAAIGVGLAAAAARVFLAMSLITESYRWSRRALLALSDSARGGHEEMHLQAALGMSLMFTGGENNAAGEALHRSLAIADQRGDARTQLWLLGTLEMFHSRIGERETALRYVRRCSEVSKIIGEPDALALGHGLFGMLLHHTGDLPGAREEFEAALAQGRGSRQTSTAYLGFNGYNMAGSGLSRTLWLLGYPVQAVQRARQTITDAAGLGHPVTLSIALVWTISVFLETGDLQSAEEHMDWFISHAQSHSLGPYLSVGRGFRGQLALLRGDTKTGVGNLRECLSGLSTTGNQLRKMEFEASLVQGLVATGDVAEGITLIDETIRVAERTDALGYMPEFLRIKGKALLAGSRPNRDEAEIYFMRSLALSRRQAARAWELRTAIDLAALLALQGRPEQARTLLRPVLEQFAEGLDTADAKAAEGLLATLI
jgi:predicted ATPase/DNA-binding winged helix-turn-helix (wHTH) protein